MKVSVRKWDAVALWKWNLNAANEDREEKVVFATHNLSQTSTLPVAVRIALKDVHHPQPNISEGEALPFQTVDVGEHDDDEDVCGICRNLFDGCCPDCSAPGDGCPISFGKCSHIFHSHCIKKWLIKQEAAGGSGTCPMDRRVWEYTS